MFVYIFQNVWKIFHVPWFQKSIALFNQCLERFETCFNYRFHVFLPCEKIGKQESLVFNVFR